MLARWRITGLDTNIGRSYATTCGVVIFFNPQGSIRWYNGGRKKTEGQSFNTRMDETMYIDPNSGGLLFQVLAILFGVFSGTVLLFSSRIKMGISRLRRNLRERSREDQNPD